MVKKTRDPPSPQPSTSAQNHEAVIMSDEIDPFPKKSDEIIYYINYGREIERDIKGCKSSAALLFVLGVITGCAFVFLVMLP